MIIGVCLPSKGRYNQMEAWIGDMLTQDLPEGVDMLCVTVAVEKSDKPTQEAVKRLQRFWLDGDVQVVLAIREDNTTAVQGWNLAYKNTPGCDWYILGADDIRWHVGWLEQALKVADETEAQVIGLNDGHTNLDDYAPHYMVHREYIELYMDGHFVPPQYMAWWFDREICQKARQHGLYAASWKSWAEHRHPDWKTARLDDTYRTAIPLRDLDRETYRQRMKLNGVHIT